MAKKNKSKNPPKWTDIYPQGTQIGDEESRFFRTLARNPKFKWRSTAALAKEANLTKERTEEIILKYFFDGKNPKGMVLQSPTNEDHWGYWERVPESLPPANQSVSQSDKDDRIDKSLCDAWVNDGILHPNVFHSILKGLNTLKFSSVKLANPADINNFEMTVEIKDEEHIVWIDEISIDSPEC